MLSLSKSTGPDVLCPPVPHLSAQLCEAEGHKEDQCGMRDQQLVIRYIYLVNSFICLYIDSFLRKMFLTQSTAVKYTILSESFYTFER